MAFVLAALTHQAVLAKDESPRQCQLTKYAAVDMRLVGGRLLIPVTINGTPVEMYLMTGMGLSSIGADAVADLKLHTKFWPMNRLSVNIGSTRVDSIAMTESLSIGSARFGRSELLVDKNWKVLLHQNSLPVVGMLGMNFFTNVDFELDFANKKLNLYSQDHCPGKVVYWADSFAAVPIRNGQMNDIYFLMELEGKKIQTSLSTSLATTSLSTDASRALFDFDEKSSGVTSETDSQGNVANHYRAMALTTEGLGIMNAKVMLIGGNKHCRLRKKTGSDNAAGYDDCLGVYPLHLGMNVLENMHIYVATKEKMMYFTAADAKHAEVAAAP